MRPRPARLLARSAAAVLGAAVLSCGGGGGPAPTPLPAEPPVTFDVAFASSSPGPGGTLPLGRVNDTPVPLTVTVTVTVPRERAGPYFFTVAVQAAHPPGTGFILPVVTTSPHVPITLVAGTNTLTFPGFHSTNAACTAPQGAPTRSLSLDVEVKTTADFFTPAFFGKKLAVTYELSCP